MLFALPRHKPLFSAERAVEKHSPISSTTGTPITDGPLVPLRADVVQFGLRKKAGQPGADATYPGQLMVASNRGPVTGRLTEDGTLVVNRGAGGLVSALAQALGADDSWVATWTGGNGEAPSKDGIRYDQLSLHAKQPDVLPPYGLHAVEITEDKADGHYNKISNGLLWPIQHSFLDKVSGFTQNDWKAYQAVNQAFAKTMFDASTPDHRIWVQDYQLMLAPAMLRQKATRAQTDRQIAYFHHIPLPPYDMMRSIPYHQELLKGLLGADLIGFHVPSYVENFLQCVEKAIPEAKVDRSNPDSSTIRYQNHVIHVKAFPISIDVEPIDQIKANPKSLKSIAEWRAKFPYEFIGMGVDRLDYSKGILNRLEAIRTLLENHPEYIGRLKFIQIASPSREDVAAYAKLKQEVTALVKDINQQFGRDDWTPIELINENVPHEKLIPLMQLSNFALLTPLRDGMNLVVKEYAVAQEKADPGVLIMSEFTGAAEELGKTAMSNPGRRAMLVNPLDVGQMAEAVHRALTLPQEARQTMNTRLQRYIRTHDVHRWRDQQLAYFDRVIAEKQAQNTPPQKAVS